MRKKLLWFESFLITLLIFLTLWLLYLLVNVSFKPLNYIAKTIESINLNDLYFSSVANHKADTSIVIINIENLDRLELSDLINHIATAPPAVLGIDIFFSEALHTPYDSLLQETLLRHRDLVVLSLPFDQEGKPDPRYWHLPEFRYGHAGLLTNAAGTQTVRDYQPVIPATPEPIHSFAVEMAASLPADGTFKPFRKNHPTEMINYTGDEQAFRILPGSSVLNEPEALLPLVKGKIVLLGFCGGLMQNSEDQSDRYFTPVGFGMEVNRRPDMYGIVVHANILSMIMQQAWISRVPDWLVYLVSFILMMLFVCLMIHLSLRWPLAFDITSLAAQLVAFVVVLWASFMLFSNFAVAFTVKYLLTCVVLTGGVLNLYIFVMNRWKKFIPYRSLFVKPDES
ncbi:MAG TPA: CHASE2 domain-containing protein [Bacteroidales bacterium]|nr:CHASE2 domain-containing protein [Bacteroidales bacterium]HRZ50029.1 CHASE2 domain-containing protein [Bacteroidales bacterium]